MTPSNHHATYYEHSALWEREPDEQNRIRIEKTLALVPPEARTILDVGCGAGALTRPLAARGKDVIGADVSIEALRHHKGAAIAADLGRLPFPDRAFDLVLCAEVLEHLPDHIYSAGLAEIARVASRWVLLTTPNEEYLPAGWVICPACDQRYHRNLHRRAFDLRTHANLLDGFTMVRSMGIGTWKRSRFFAALEHRGLGARPDSPHAVCPACGHLGVPAPRVGRTRHLLLRAVRRLRKSLPPPSRPRWLASLYKRGAPA